VATGNQSLRYNVSGERNTAVGDYALKGDRDDVGIIDGTGNDNVAIGSNALVDLSTGSKNIAIGTQAGNSMVSNDGSVFIGYQAGMNETNGNRLYIENSNADSTGALIFGNFSSDILRTNVDYLEIRHKNSDATAGLILRNKGVNNNQFRLNVKNSGNGNLEFYSSNTITPGTAVATIDGSTGAYSNISDKRLKKDFENLYFNWNNFMSLNALTYRFKSQKDTKKHIGFIAQEINKIYPELIDYNKKDDRYLMDYSGFGVIAIKAVQELKKEVTKLTLENKKLKQQLAKYNTLEARLSALENNTNSSNTDFVVIKD